MKLPEAIALMLEGKVMVDRLDDVYRIYPSDSGLCSLQRLDDDVWMPEECSLYFIDGWREATPEELKEIGL